MPQNQNLTPRKKFQFEVTIFRLGGVAPLEPFAVQSITLPESTIEPVEHGHGNTVLKTGGQVKLSNLTLNRILDANSAALSDYFFAWHKSVMDGLLNSAGFAAQYKSTIHVKELGIGTNIPGQGTSLRTWVFVGCWPTKISSREYDRTSSDNVIDSIEFSVDFMD